MPKIEELSNRQIKDHIAKQKMWQGAYLKTDPSSMCIETAQEIINDLYKELEKRGVKCPQ